MAAPQDARRPEHDQTALKVVVPQINVDGVLWLGLFAPQFARGETHGVNVLRLLALEMGVGVRENKDSVVAVDGAQLCRARNAAAGCDRPD